MSTMDLTLDAAGTVPDWRESVRRLRVPALVLAAAVTAALLLRGPAEAVGDALRQVASADPRWVAAAAAFEVVSFAGYIALLWHVAGREAPRFGLRASYQATL